MRVQETYSLTSLALLLTLMPFLSWGCPMEENFIFFPDAKINGTPRAIGLPQASVECIIDGLEWKLRGERKH